MADMRKWMEGGTRGFDPEPDEGLRRAMRRARSRQRRRRAVTAIVVLGIAGAGFAVAWSAFGRSAGTPAAGPTPTSSGGLRGQVYKIGREVLIVTRRQGEGRWDVSAFRAVYPNLGAASSGNWHPRPRPPRDDIGVCVRVTTSSYPLIGCYSQLLLPPSHSGTAPYRYELSPGDPTAVEADFWAISPRRVPGPGVLLGQGEGGVVVGWASAETSSVAVSTSGSTAYIGLHGPFGDVLRTNAKWFATRVPHEDRPATFTARDQDGNVLWTEVVTG